ncbi:hypothetical protein CUR178_06603 [Leishmania enriettii]|uniref:Uncharacterized protein n=1 Tax=Leishmania enriettii TaxID=5663 RepID=A0A836L187_LEIEN|nr:hypothetical protein CUR178_06603 [Leishmania enriettii]
MFVRMRGKGASPENSQAAVTHLRGFRHTHSSPPSDCFYSVLLLPPSSAPAPLGVGATGSAEEPSVLPKTAMQPFRFALFPFGIQARLAAAQTQCTKPSTATSSAAGASGVVTAASPLSLPTTLNSEVARMLWKETWNLYDILYDEVPLLPWVETIGDGVAAALVETVERELGKLASSDAAAATMTPLHSLASLADKTDDFKLASARTGNQQVVVCPHYYSSVALPESAFHGVGRHRASQSVESLPAALPLPMKGPVVVLDLSDLPVAQAGGKAMVNIAWYTAFAAMQPDSVLLRCRAIVVRLPYTSAPIYTQACRHRAPSSLSAGAAPTMADAFLEAVDFIGEHITAVHRGMVLALETASPELAAKDTAAPPVAVIGSTPAALGDCLRSLFGIAAASGTEGPEGASVVVLHGDHLGMTAVGSSGASDAHRAADARTAHVIAHWNSIAETCGCPMELETVPVPLKALLDGGEEPWDEYTLRERGRLNFCPCCGDCADEHSHGHRRGDDYQ